MSRARRRLEQASLFDLDLERGDGTSTEPAPPAAAEPAGDPDPEGLGAAESEPSPELPPALETPHPALAAAVLYAGLVDLAVHLVVLAAAVLGAGWLGVATSASALPGLALLVAVFSFVYSVIPLAFWSRTPGMSLAGLRVRSDDDLPLTFGQAGRRWLSGWVTLVGVGLPGLPKVFGRRSLADVWSRSRPWTD